MSKSNRVFTNRRQYKPRRAIAEDEVINYLNNYFEHFSNNLLQNNVSRIDTRLPVLIAEKFTELFELWDENRTLERRINKKIFEKVYSLMSNSNTFDNHGKGVEGNIASFDGIRLECESCGEQIVMRNNNLQYSLEFHKTTREHVEFMRCFDAEGSCDEDRSKEVNDNVKSQDVVSAAQPYEQFFIYCNCDLCDIEIPISVSEMFVNSTSNSITSHLKSSLHRKNLNIFRYNEKYIEMLTTTEENKFRCMSCSETYSMDELIEHFNCKDHRKNVFDKFFINEFDTDCLFELDDTIGCRLCRVKLNCEQDFITHVAESHHKTSVRLYQVNLHHNVKFEGNVFRCTLCNEGYTEAVSLLKHCRELTHVEKFNARVSEDEVNAGFENECRVDAFVAEFPCPICLKPVIGLKSLYSHYRLCDLEKSSSA